MTPQKPKFYLPFLCFVFLIIKLISFILIYKIIYIEGYAVSEAALIIPFWFMLGDIITEVYGYPIAKRLIWITITCQFILALYYSLVIDGNAPYSLIRFSQEKSSLHSLPQVALSNFCAIYCAGILNAYAIAKSKILLKGRYFWLRSLGASVIGELVFTCVTYAMNFSGLVSFRDLIQLISLSCFIKLLLNPLLALAGQFIIFLLHELERNPSTPRPTL